MEWMGYEHDSSESEDSDQSELSDLWFPEVNPAHAARAALLVARFAAAIQATKELQTLHNRPQLLALEKLVLKCLDKGGAAFLNQKRIFGMMPPPLKAKINRELRSKWRRPPLVGELMDSHTRHLYLDLKEPTYADGVVVEWTLQHLERLCDHVAREGKNSLQSLWIRSLREPKGRFPGLPVTMLGSLLLELRALTSLHLVCYAQVYETDLLVSILASTNPDIRSLQLPHLSNKSLRTIADRWPQLELLKPYPHEFDSSQLEAVLPRLRNLETLDIYNRILSEVMMSVARAHDPASPPYKLAEGFDCSSSRPPVSSADIVKVFTAFPAVQQLTMLEMDIPAVCAGLEGREHIHITELEVKPTSPDPRALEPLLARVGQHVTKLKVTNYEGFSGNRVDLNMIGHYCPKIGQLTVAAGELIAGDEFEVTETHFSKLKYCHLYHNREGHGTADLPDDLVCRVLASPTLENVDSRGVPITEEVVAALAAERGRGALSSLERLTVWRPTPVSVEALAGLASHAPRLRYIFIQTEDVDDQGVVEMRGVLDSFMQQSELKARVLTDFTQ